MVGAEGCKNCAGHEARVARLEALLEKSEVERARLQARVEELERELKRNSTNSSRPPSTDPPQVREARPAKPPTGRPPGGQPGHEGHMRELLPESEVDQLVHVFPDRCKGCKRKFKKRHLRRRAVAQVRRHQVTEIPEPKPQTTEWQLHGVACPGRGCDVVTWAELPEGVPPGRFGPRAQAVAAMLTGRFRSSRREAQVQMEDLFGVSIAVGEISAIEQKVSAALEQPVQEAQQYAQSQSAAGADETSWPQGTRKGERKAWLWVMLTGLVSVFMILRHRSTEAAKTLLGGFRGILTTDRWWAYQYHGLRRRQLCWAHLIRDFKEMTERRDRASREIGEQLLQEARQMFAWWNRVRDGTLSRSSFQVYMVALRHRVRQRLREGARCRNNLTARTCRDLLKLFAALWTFVRVRGVEPTNNACERALRPAVLWRKGCFGSRSLAGSQFAARMLTTVATLKQQGRNLLEFLTLAVGRYQVAKPPPSLLPNARVLARLQAAS